jgi:glutamate--cysteine ligase
MAPSGRCQVGVELEWLTVRTDDPGRPADSRRVRDAASALGPLPGGSRITYEPGGQIELSSPALPGLGACDALRRDLAVLAPALAAAGVALVAVGLEPGTPRERVISNPRYDAMEAFFDSDGGAGRTMMRSTAAFQVNVDHGGPDELERRWNLAHDVAPVLAAAFANSPLAHGRPSGWCSTRLSVWSALDPGRSALVGRGPGRAAWADYALDARVMLVRCSATDHVALTDGVSFGDWVRQGHALGWPTVEDLDYHLTTLFPPVRPKGWLELRMIDALPDPWWRVAAAVSAALISEPDIADEVAAATEPVRDAWTVAARCGLADPELARAARRCFAAAADAATAAGADTATLDDLADFTDHYVARGRCPADDRLESYHRGGALVPAPEGAVHAWN